MTHPYQIDVSTLTVAQTAEVVSPERAKPSIEPEKVSVWPQLAEAIEIINQATYDYAVDFLKRDLALQDAAEAHHRPMIKAAFLAHRATTSGLQTVLEPLLAAETTVKRKIAAWSDQQTKLALEAQKQAAALATQRHAEELELEIEAAETAGANVEEVKTIIQEAQYQAAIVPAVAPTYAKAKGISTPERWSAEVIDMRKFQIAVAKNPAYASLLIVNQTALNKLAAGLKNGLVIDGVKVNRETNVSSRR
jgi:hypothetical protein